METEEAAGEGAQRREQLMAEYAPVSGDESLKMGGIEVLTARNSPPDISQTPEYQALGDILAFYLANHDVLCRQQALQKAQNEARRRWAEAHPQNPKPATVQFWPLKNPKPLTPKE